MANDLNLFESEMGALESMGARMPLTLTPREAWALLMILQNAVLLRLTDTQGDQQFARGLAEQIEGRLCKTPAMKERAEQASKSPQWAAPSLPTEDACGAGPPEESDRRSAVSDRQAEPKAGPEKLPAKRVSKRR
jgi:hypothetical protein